MKRHELGPQEHYAMRRPVSWCLNQLKPGVVAAIGALVLGTLHMALTTWIALQETAASERIAREERQRAISDSVMSRGPADSAARARQRRLSEAELRAKAKERLAAVVTPIAPAVATAPDTQRSAVEAGAPERVDVMPGARWTGRVRPTESIPGVVPNGKLVVASDNGLRQMPLPGGGTLLLWPGSRFTFSLDSAPVMLGMLVGEMVLFVPDRESWRIHTLGGTFTLGTGRYAVRSWDGQAGAEITIDSGGVYVAGDSVVGRRVFALVRREEPTLQRVGGAGFPVVPRVRSSSGGDRAAVTTGDSGGSTPIVPGGRPASPVERVGDIPPLITNGYRLRTAANESARLPLPAGATVLLQPGGVFIFSGDSAPVINGILAGEMVLSVARGSLWQIKTWGGTVTLGEGRYAVRGLPGGSEAWISVDSGGVYVPGDSVVGKGVFVRVRPEPLTLERVEDGREFPVLPPESW